MNEEKPHRVIVEPWLQTGSRSTYTRCNWKRKHMQSLLLPTSSTAHAKNTRRVEQQHREWIEVAEWPSDDADTCTKGILVEICYA